MHFFIPAKSPFSLHQTIYSHGWIRLAPFEADETKNGFRYIMRSEAGQVFELLVTEADGGIQVNTDFDLDESTQDEIGRNLTWMLNLNLDLTDFYLMAKDEPKLAYMDESAKGRILRSPTLFEDTIKTILTTNTSWAGTIRMVDSLVTQFGTPIHDGSGRHAFPTPKQLAETNVDILRSQTRLGYRAPYVFELANRISRGELDLEVLKTSNLPTSELFKQLLAIKGVGNYAAANLLMILGRYDHIPIDSWATKVVSIEWYSGESIGPDQVEAAFENWGSWKGLAYWFWDWSYYHLDE